jgi:hypothetical protein
LFYIQNTGAWDIQLILPPNLCSIHPCISGKHRVAVAPAGSSFLDGEGSMQEVTKATVGGIVSEGMFCDSRMLGWSGGAQGVAAQIPDSCEIGSAPPATKPRPGGAGGDNVSSAESSVAGLFEKKLTKEEKKKLAEERRKARKAAKVAKTNAAK